VKTVADDSLKISYSGPSALSGQTIEEIKKIAKNYGIDLDAAWAKKAEAGSTTPIKFNPTLDDVLPRSGTGFDDPDSSAAETLKDLQAIKSTWGSPSPPMGEQAARTTQRTSPIPSWMTEWRTGKAAAELDKDTYAVPPKDASIYNLQSNIPGAIVRSPEEVGQPKGQEPAYYAERYQQGGLDKGVDKAIRAGKPKYFYQIDHIVPLWLSGADTVENKRLLSYDQHQHATAVGKVLQKLYSPGKDSLGNQIEPIISKREAQNLVINSDSLPILTSLGKKDAYSWEPTLKEAQQTLAYWRGDRKWTSVGVKGVLKALKDDVSGMISELPGAADLFAKNDSFLGASARGMIDGLTFGATASKDAPPDTVIEKAGSIMGNMIGALVPIEGFAKVAGLGLPFLFKGLARNAVAGSRVAQLASRVGKTYITVPRLDALSLAKNTLGLAAYGQVATTLEPDASLGQRIRRLAVDMAYGPLGTFSPPGLRGVPTMFAGAFTISALEGYPMVDALTNAGTMALFHGVSGRGNATRVSRAADASANAYWKSLGLPELPSDPMKRSSLIRNYEQTAISRIKSFFPDGGTPFEDEVARFRVASARLERGPVRQPLIRDFLGFKPAEIDVSQSLKNDFADMRAMIDAGKVTKTTTLGGVPDGVWTAADALNSGEHLDPANMVEVKSPISGDRTILAEVGGLDTKRGGRIKLDYEYAQQHLRMASGDASKDSRLNDRNDAIVLVRRDPSEEPGIGDKPVVEAWWIEPRAEGRPYLVGTVADPEVLAIMDANGIRTMLAKAANKDNWNVGRPAVEIDNQLLAKSMVLDASAEAFRQARAVELPIADADATERADERPEVTEPAKAEPGKTEPAAQEPAPETVPAAGAKPQVLPTEKPAKVQISPEAKTAEEVPTAGAKPEEISTTEQVKPIEKPAEVQVAPEAKAVEAPQAEAKTVEVKPTETIPATEKPAAVPGAEPAKAPEEAAPKAPEEPVTGFARWYRDLPKVEAEVDRRIAREKAEAEKYPKGMAKSQAKLKAELTAKQADREVTGEVKPELSVGREEGVKPIRTFEEKSPEGQREHTRQIVEKIYPKLNEIAALEKKYGILGVPPKNYGGMLVDVVELDVAKGQQSKSERKGQGSTGLAPSAQKYVSKVLILSPREYSATDEFSNLGYGPKETIEERVARRKSADAGLKGISAALRRFTAIASEGARKLVNLKKSEITPETHNSFLGWRVDPAGKKQRLYTFYFKDIEPTSIGKYSNEDAVGEFSKARKAYLKKLEASRTGSLARFVAKLKGKVRHDLPTKAEAERELSRRKSDALVWAHEMAEKASGKISTMGEPASELGILSQKVMSEALKDPGVIENDPVVIITNLNSDEAALTKVMRASRGKENVLGWYSDDPTRQVGLNFQGYVMPKRGSAFHKPTALIVWSGHEKPADLGPVVKDYYAKAGREGMTKKINPDAKGATEMLKSNRAVMVMFDGAKAAPKAAKSAVNAELTAPEEFRSFIRGETLPKYLAAKEPAADFPAIGAMVGDYRQRTGNNETVVIVSDTTSDNVGSSPLFAENGVRKVENGNYVVFDNARFRHKFDEVAPKDNEPWDVEKFLPGKSLLPKETVPAYDRFNDPRPSIVKFLLTHAALSGSLPEAEARRIAARRAGFEFAQDRIERNVDAYAQQMREHLEESLVPKDLNSSKEMIDAIANQVKDFKVKSGGDSLDEVSQAMRHKEALEKNLGWMADLVDNSVKKETEEWQPALSRTLADEETLLLQPKELITGRALKIPLPKLAQGASRLDYLKAKLQGALGIVPKPEEPSTFPRRPEDRYLDELTAWRKSYIPAQDEGGPYPNGLKPFAAFKEWQRRNPELWINKEAKLKEEIRIKTEADINRNRFLSAFRGGISSSIVTRNRDLEPLYLKDRVAASIEDARVEARNSQEWKDAERLSDEKVPGNAFEDLLKPTERQKAQNEIEANHIREYLESQRFYDDYLTSRDLAEPRQPKLGEPEKEITNPVKGSEFLKLRRLMPATEKPLTFEAAKTPEERARAIEALISEREAARIEAGGEPYDAAEYRMVKEELERNEPVPGRIVRILEHERRPKAAPPSIAAFREKMKAADRSALIPEYQKGKPLERPLLALAEKIHKSTTEEAKKSFGRSSAEILGKEGSFEKLPKENQLEIVYNLKKQKEIDFKDPDFRKSLAKGMDLRLKMEKAAAEGKTAYGKSFNRTFMSYLDKALPKWQFDPRFSALLTYMSPEGGVRMMPVKSEVPGAKDVWVENQGTNMKMTEAMAVLERLNSVFSESNELNLSSLDRQSVAKVLRTTVMGYTKASLKRGLDDVAREIRSSKRRIAVESRDAISDRLTELTERLEDARTEKDIKEIANEIQNESIMTAAELGLKDIIDPSTYLLDNLAKKMPGFTIIEKSANDPMFQKGGELEHLKVNANSSEAASYARFDAISLADIWLDSYDQNPMSKRLSDRNDDLRIDARQGKLKPETSLSGKAAPKAVFEALFNLGEGLAKRRPDAGVEIRPYSADALPDLTRYETYREPIESLIRQGENVNLVYLTQAGVPELNPSVVLIDGSPVNFEDIPNVAAKSRKVESEHVPTEKIDRLTGKDTVWKAILRVSGKEKTPGGKTIPDLNIL